MRTKNSGPERIGSLIESVLSELGLAGAYWQHRAMQAWDEAVGEILARVTEPERIEHGRMFVKVRDSSWRQELHYYRGEIMKRLNENLNRRVVRDIIFV